MEVRHADRKLDRLERDADYTAGFGSDVVKAFRKRMAFIRGALDERAFYSMKSLHFERLKGKRKDQCSMRVNDQFRLVLRLEEHAGEKFVTVIEIADYH